MDTDLDMQYTVTQMACQYFTGGNSSRFEGKWFIEVAKRKQVRLIVPDRPGFGLSDFKPARRLLDWPDDVLELVDTLLIERFSVFGLSGGEPHVLATAYRIPDRIKRTAIVSGTAPPEMRNRFNGMWPPVRLIFLTAKYLPAANRFLLKQMAKFYSDVKEMTKRMKQAMPPPDALLLEQRPEIIEIFALAAQEAHRNGVNGDALEWKLYVNPWGFELEHIKIPICLWYGLHDKQVPIGMGQYLAQKIPYAHLKQVEDGGHFSTVNNYIDEILEYAIGDSDENMVK